MSTYLVGSTTTDVASIADGNEVTVAVTVTGAALGDFVSELSCSIDSLDLTLSAEVTGANAVTVVLANNTGGAIDLGSATYRVRVTTLSGLHIT